MFPLVVSALLATLIATFYLYTKYAYSYWKRRGVPFIPPSIPFGNFGPMVLRKRSIDQNLFDLYNSSEEKVVGAYMVFRPILLVRDPKIIYDIFVKDFQHFWHRGFHYDDKHDPMAINLFAKSGPKWKEMRNMMSPAFTSSKLKGMVETIVACGKSFQDCIEEYAVSGKEAEVRKIFINFTTNVIASIGFGIDVDCFKEPNNEFKKYSRGRFEGVYRNTFRLYFSFVSPFLMKVLGVRFVDKKLKDYMTEIVRQNLEYREANNVVRKDFFQLMIQLRNEGKLDNLDDHDWDLKITTDKTLSLDEIAAQAYLFISAGYESSSTTMTFCMYELAKNQSLQQEVYEEIRDVLDKFDGTITYESLNEMKLLDCCIDETLRIHPPFDALFRECTKDYKIADTDIYVKKGTALLFSVTGPQLDPKYYDQPNTFIPQRFLNEGFSKNSPTTPYLAFGDGPRNCIAARLGKLQAKIGVCLMLRKFLFELGAQYAEKEVEIDPGHVAREPVDGMYLKVTKR